jgi:hypothetical protein
MTALGNRSLEAFDTTAQRGCEVRDGKENSLVDHEWRHRYSRLTGEQQLCDSPVPQAKAKRGMLCDSQRQGTTNPSSISTNTSAAALNSGTVTILSHDFVDEIMHP